MATINDIGVSRFLEYLSEDVFEMIYKIEFLRDEDESVYATIEDDAINGGSLNISFNEGVRRTCSFTIINDNLKYNSIIDGLTLNSKFKLYSGYVIDGLDVLIPKGVFYFDNPSFISSNSSRTIVIKGTDKWAGLNGVNSGILEGTYVAEAGTDFSDLVKSLLLINIASDPIDPIIDTSLSTLQLPYDITRNAGETVSDIILEACYAVSAYCYYNTEGQLVVEPFTQDSLKGSVYEFSKDNKNYIQSSKTQLNGDVYNSVQITADNIQNSSVALYYEALNERADDKNSIINLGKKKVKVVTEYTEGIQTEEELEIRALWELQRYTLNDSSYSISSRPIFQLDVNQVVTLTDDASSTNEDRCLVLSISEPIGTSGLQNITAKKAVDNFG